GGKVVSRASLAKMTTPFKEEYGFGLIIHSDNGHKQIVHAGGINGFGTQLAWYPDDKLVIVVLDNIANGATGQVMANLAAINFGRPVTLISERKVVPVDSKVLQRYVGRYELRPDFVLEITLD